MVRIGIDVGLRNTGLAVIQDGVYTEIRKMEQYPAMRHVLFLVLRHNQIHVTIENPHMRNWFGDTGEERKQGAGYVKAEFEIWVQFFLEHDISFTSVSPQSVGSTFDDIQVFKAATGWKKRTSKHARDAAKMIFQYKTK